jgi:hypothetical protein
MENKQYRLLRAGEKINNSDQFNWGSDERPEWGDSTCQGDFVKEAGDYRREITVLDVQEILTQLKKLTKAVEAFVEHGGKESIILKMQRKNSRHLLDILNEKE